MSNKHAKQVGRIKELLTEINTIMDEMEGNIKKTPEEKKKEYLDMPEEEREVKDKKDLGVEEEKE